MGNASLEKIKNKIEDHMLLGSIYDNIMRKFKYNGPRLSFKYNVMMSQKHRMLYYKMLKKKFLEKCTSDRPWEKLEKRKNADTIWMCWLQGIDNAPLLVKRCYESVKKNAQGKNIILLDENNIFDYVDMPDYIIDKWKKGIIGAAHFTDLVRLSLLIKHGGYWIDMTVLCTDGSIFKYIDDEPLFMYSFYYFGFSPEIMELNNWFMYSSTNNNILWLTRESLYEYWKKYDRAVNYFVFQIVMTVVLEYYNDEYRRMPIVSQVDAHVLASYIYSDYDSRKYELLKLSTGIHKLSTRFNEKWLEKSGTFYDEVIRKGNY